MGRHSAADDDEEPEGTVAVADDAAAPDDAGDLAERLAAERRGRHVRGADVETTGPVPGAALRRLAERASAQDEQPTERLDLAAIEAALAAPPHDAAPPPEPVATEPPAAVAPAAKPPKRSRAAQSTSADLALLRRHADIRNRVIGAALVPFVLYAAVLLIATAPAAQFLIWIWIPMVTAGVLVGFMLDSGHKRHPDEPEKLAD